MRNKLLFLAVLCALTLSVACGGGKEEAASGGDQGAAAGGEQAAAPAAPAADAGTVTGTITYNGPDPDVNIPMNADAACAGAHTTPVQTEKIVANGGKLANVFIYVKDGLAGKSFPAPAEAKVIDQQGCTYHPHVQGIQVGQKLQIKNSDPTLHNIHALPAKNTEFNQAQPQGINIEKSFDKPEVMVHVKCDVHPWMSSYLGVVDNPFYAVSAEDGTFSIKGLPPGTYTLEAWQEELGTQTKQVTVAPNGTVTADFDFKPKA
jgi:plastocyanin